MPNNLVKLNTNFIRLEGLFYYDSVGAKNYDNNSIVTVKLQRNEVDIDGEAWPLNIPYVTDSNGIYYVTFNDDIDITKGENIGVVVNSSSANGKAEWEGNVIVGSRVLDGSIETE